MRLLKICKNKLYMQNNLKKKLSINKTTIGTWNIMPSVKVVDVICSTGIDFIIVDREHSSVNFETAQNIVMTCNSRSVTPIMRVSNLCENEILRALEIGFNCIQIPNIENEEDVKRAISFMKYPPKGNRGFSPFTKVHDYFYKDAHKDFQKINEDTCLIIQIESQLGIKNLEKILKISDVDIIFLGLFDLSKSINLPGQTTHPKVRDLLKKLTKDIHDAKKISGTIVTNEEQLNNALDIGIKYITYSVDCHILSKGYLSILNQFNTFNKEVSIYGIGTKK